MYDHDLLQQIYEEKPPLTFRRAMKYAAGAIIVFAVMVLFVFLAFRAMEIESRYYWQWDNEQQTYFRAERGV